ncbi:LysR family transcriptional regulator [Oceanomicrobium pacificus]|uniref:LysR family transcriptional regulator n=1 Tax=Oceanomicrobium pacificus TaxID=2692916 RepID=A0A6B0TNU7_9RHOB|nr:LysR family transcriptional regulator [Oceanomicrobium pacificus]MXU66227.1 LysR family transcriptional regulator [Oceanomicrobium pacificus]
MDWDDIRIFLAVARAASISGAARRLGVQHSTVSRRIRQMEERLGTTLLDRSHGRFALSEAGEELRFSAERMESEILGYESRLGGLDSEETGTLRLSTVSNLAATILMPMLTGFSDAHPGITLHVDVSNDFVSLANREADVAIRLTNTPRETLIGARLGTVASAVYGKRGRAGGLDAPPPWLGVSCCDLHVGWLRENCPDGDHRFFVNDTLLTLAALREGAGMAHLPCFMGDADPLLERLSAPDRRHDLDLWLLYHPELARTQRVRVFRRHMIDRFAPLQDLLAGKVKAPQGPRGIAQPG